MRITSIATVDKFMFIRPQLLIGELLEEVKTLENSIKKLGLLSPIIVRQYKNQLIVINGRKRLAAIRRLRFMGQLPRSLVNIPYIALSELNNYEEQAPILMSNAELYKYITQASEAGENENDIAKDLYLSRRCIQQILSLKYLSPSLKDLFFQGDISFEQARLYASQPDIEVQDRVFNTLGPFAEAKLISQTLLSDDLAQDDNAAREDNLPKLAGNTIKIQCFRNLSEPLLNFKIAA